MTGAKPERAPEAIARAAVNALASAPCPHGPPAPDEPWAADCFQCIEAAFLRVIRDVLPVVCLSGHRAPLDEWGRECRTCVAVRQERERIAAELRRMPPDDGTVGWEGERIRRGLLADKVLRLEAPGGTKP